MKRTGEGQVIILVGQRGSGKTTLLRKLVAKCRRVLVCDTEQDWKLGPRDQVVEGAPALLQALRDLGAVENPRKPFRLVYRDAAEQMQTVGPGVALAVQNLTLVIDELVWVCHAHYLPPYLKRVLQVGRKRAINLLGTTREPQEVHDLLFSQAALRYFFRVEPGNGLDRIRGRYRAIWQDLPDLGRGQYRTDGDLDAIQVLGREGLDKPA